MKRLMVVWAVVMVVFGLGMNSSEAAAHITWDRAVEAIERIDENYSDRAIRQVVFISDGDEDAELVMLVLLDEFNYSVENYTKFYVSNAKGLWQYTITYRVPMVAKNV